MVTDMSVAENTEHSAMQSSVACERRILRERIRMQRAPARYIVMKAGKRMNTLLLDSLYPAGQKRAAQNRANWLTTIEQRDSFVAVIIDHNFVQVAVKEKK
jgi:hypothetical protein